MMLQAASPCHADVPEDTPPFKYKGFGSLAYIGHGAAVIDPVKSASVLGYIRCAIQAACIRWDSGASRAHKSEDSMPNKRV